MITSWNRTGGCAGAGIGGGCYYVGGWYGSINLYSGDIPVTIDSTAIIDPIALNFLFQSVIDLAGNGTLGPFEFDVIDFHQTPGFFNSTTAPSSGFFNSGTGANSGLLNSGAGGASGIGNQITVTLPGGQGCRDYSIPGPCNQVWPTPATPSRDCSIPALSTRR